MADTDPKPAQGALDGTTPAAAKDAKKRAGRPRADSASGKGSAGTRSPGRPTQREQTIKQLETQLGDAFAGIGLLVLAASPADGVVIIDRGPQLAAALARWAAENEQVRRVLEKALQASAVGQVVAALAAILIPIASNHGLVPSQFGAAFGTPNVPADLTAMFGNAPDFPPADGGA